MRTFSKLMRPENCLPAAEISSPRLYFAPSLLCLSPGSSSLVTIGDVPGETFPLVAASALIRLTPSIHASGSSWPCRRLTPRMTKLEGPLMAANGEGGGTSEVQTTRRGRRADRGLAFRMTAHRHWTLARVRDPHDREQVTLRKIDLSIGDVFVFLPRHPDLYRSAFRVVARFENGGRDGPQAKLAVPTPGDELEVSIICT